MNDEIKNENINLEKKKKPLFLILTILLTIVHCLWMFLCYRHMKAKNILLYPFHSSGLRFILQSIIAFIPALISYIVTVICFRKNFYKKTDMVKPNRYHFTLVLTSLYTLFLPLLALLSPNDRGGVAAWFFYLFFVSYLQVFLFDALVPYLLINIGGLGERLSTLTGAILFSFASISYPLSVYGPGKRISIFCVGIFLINFVLYYFLNQTKKWTGALWLPTITYALLSLISSFLTEGYFIMPF